MNFKDSVHAHYQKILEDKIGMLENSLLELKEMGANESKSTAGDKHETALAMIQIEQDQLRNQLQDTISDLKIVQLLPREAKLDCIAPGSLIKTDVGYYYLSLALGKAIIMDNQVIALSNHSPLGKEFIGKRVNDIVEVNGRKYKIEAIQ